MDKDQQFNIADDIIKAFTEEFLATVAIIPENWDGFEIRQLAVDWMEENYAIKDSNKTFGDNRSQRRKDYENYKIINNLV